MFKPRRLIVILLFLLVLYGETIAQEIENSTKAPAKPENDDDESPTVFDDKPFDDGSVESEDKPDTYNPPEPEFVSPPGEDSNHTLNSAMEAVIKEIAKAEIDIEGLNTLKLDKCDSEPGQFRCTASATGATIAVDEDKKLPLNLKLLLWGRIRRARVTKVRLADAHIDLKSLPGEFSMSGRSAELGGLQRQLRRQYRRLARATKWAGRKVLPLQIHDSDKPN